MLGHIIQNCSKLNTTSKNVGSAMVKSHNVKDKITHNTKKGSDAPGSINLVGRNSEAPNGSKSHKRDEQMLAKPVLSQDEQFESFDEFEEGELSPTLNHNRNTTDMSQHGLLVTAEKQPQQKLVLHNPFELLEDDENTAWEARLVDGDFTSIPTEDVGSGNMREGSIEKENIIHPKNAQLVQPGVENFNKPTSPSFVSTCLMMRLLFLLGSLTTRLCSLL
jgi:hypothetical protein